MNKLLISLIALLLVGCSDPIVHKYKRDIVSVYYHEGNDYSVGIFDTGLLTIKRLPPAAHVSVWLDVSPEDNMWYECDFTRYKFTGDTTGGCNIHMHDIDDLNTAGWNHGKFGSGTTTRID